jgi:hypothetical protein
MGISSDAIAQNNTGLGTVRDEVYSAFAQELVAVLFLFCLRSLGRLAVAGRPFTAG